MIKYTLQEVELLPYNGFYSEDTLYTIRLSFERVVLWVFKRNVDFHVRVNWQRAPEVVRLYKTRIGVTVSSKGKIIK